MIFDIALGESCAVRENLLRTKIMDRISSNVNLSNKSQMVNMDDETIFEDEDNGLLCSFLADYITAELSAYELYVRIYCLNSVPSFKSKYIVW